MKGTSFVSIVVLAAGLSTRFGRNKLFEPIGSTTLVEHVVSEALNSQASQVVVVGGHDFTRLQNKLQWSQCEVVYNEEFEKGQSFSVRRGLSAVSPKADAAMIIPGDMAFMNLTLINAVIEEYALTGAPIVSAGYHGRPGHPILFGRALFEELKSIDEATRGLKKVVSAHLSETRVLETSIASLFDMDTPKDLSRFNEFRLQDQDSK